MTTKPVPREYGPAVAGRGAEARKKETRNVFSPNDAQLKTKARRTLRLLAQRLNLNRDEKRARRGLKPIDQLTQLPLILHEDMSASALCC